MKERDKNRYNLVELDKLKERAMKYLYYKIIELENMQLKKTKNQQYKKGQQDTSSQ